MSTLNATVPGLMLAQQNSGGNVIVGIIGLIFFVLYIALIVLVIAGIWKTFVKAGHPGWAAIIPVYNLYILTQIVGRPWWWLLLMFVPLVNIAVLIVVSIDIAKSFGQSPLFGVGLALLSPIFFCILGFGSAQYQGPAAAGKMGL